MLWFFGLQIDWGRAGWTQVANSAKAVAQIARLASVPVGHGSGPTKAPESPIKAGYMNPTLGAVYYA
jgi:hypothetical protein